jgi:hypothetical protein
LTALQDLSTSGFTAWVRLALWEHAGRCKTQNSMRVYTLQGHGDS